MKGVQLLNIFRNFNVDWNLRLMIKYVNIIREDVFFRKLSFEYADDKILNLEEELKNSKIILNNLKYTYNGG